MQRHPERYRAPPFRCLQTCWIPIVGLTIVARSMRPVAMDARPMRSRSCEYQNPAAGGTRSLIGYWHSPRARRCLRTATG